MVIAIEATGSLHRAWSAELERRYPGAVRLFAPSETKAARTQLGSGRFKTDDRDCAALTYLARQGGGRRWAEEVEVDALRAVVRHRRGLVHDRKVIQQRLHDQLNALVPGTVGAGRARPQPGPGPADRVRRCWPARPRSPAGRRRCGRCEPGPAAGSAQPTARVLGATVAWLPAAATRRRAAGRTAGPRPGPATKRCRPTSPRSRRELEPLLIGSDGQVLTTLPGVAVVRAAGFAAHSLPISRFPDAEHLYSATGLAPALYQSATIRAPRPDLPPGPGRTPRRADGHRLGAVAATHPRSPNATASTAPAAWPRSRPGSRWPGTPAASPTGC